MKILTLNTHSLLEENQQQKLAWFVEGILKEKPDIIAMQEVNQTANAAFMELELLEGQYPIPGCMQIRADNYAALVASRLRKAGIDCYWAWLPVKRGYDRYDEGITVPGKIDGWRESHRVKPQEGMRLDYIWCNRKRTVLSSRVVFNGIQEPVVSDHFGVLIEVKE